MKNIVIVDGYSSGKYYAIQFKALGCKVLHVQSSTEVYAIFGGEHDVTQYQQNLKFDGANFEEIVTELKKANPTAIIPGTESGVLLADKLSDALQLKCCNDIVLSQARRNKYEMSEAVKRQGLDTIKQCRTANLEAGLEFVKGIGFPVVVKEIDGAGGHGFAICRNDVEFKLAFENILKSTNPFDKRNSEVLVQEFVRGEEYAVNSVSKAGRHYITEVVKYKKREEDSGGLIYETSTLQTYEDVQRNGVVDYAQGVLTALGIIFGPGHTEVMVTPEGRCLLIECGARLAGGSLPPEVMESCLEGGKTQIKLSASVYAGRDDIDSCFGKPYIIKAYLCKVFGISTQTGQVTATTDAYDDIMKLPNFNYLNEHFKKEMSVQRTRDFSPPLTLYLVAHTRKLIEHDTAAFRELEAQGFFKVVLKDAASRFLGGVKPPEEAASSAASSCTM